MYLFLYFGWHYTGYPFGGFCGAKSLWGKSAKRNQEHEGSQKKISPLAASRSFALQEKGCHLEIQKNAFMCKQRSTRLGWLAIWQDNFHRTWHCKIPIEDTLTWSQHLNRTVLRQWVIHFICQFSFSGTKKYSMPKPLGLVGWASLKHFSHDRDVMVTNVRSAAGLPSFSLGIVTAKEIIRRGCRDLGLVLTVGLLWHIHLGFSLYFCFCPPCMQDRKLPGTGDRQKPNLPHKRWSFFFKIWYTRSASFVTLLFQLIPLRVYSLYKLISHLDQYTW